METKGIDHDYDGYDFESSKISAEEVSRISAEGRLKYPEIVLDMAKETMIRRGKLRDNGSERSMKRIVNVFEALTGHKLTEGEGWTFMVVLKLCREQTGPDLDNWVDGAAYMALAAEAVSRKE